MAARRHVHTHKYGFESSTLAVHTNMKTKCSNFVWRTCCVAVLLFMICVCSAALSTRLDRAISSLSKSPKLTTKMPASKKTLKRARERSKQWARQWEQMQQRTSTSLPSSWVPSSTATSHADWWNSRDDELEQEAKQESEEDAELELAKEETEQEWDAAAEDTCCKTMSFLHHLHAL